MKRREWITITEAHTQDGGGCRLLASSVEGEILVDFDANDRVTTYIRTGANFGDEDEARRCAIAAARAYLRSGQRGNVHAGNMFQP